MGAIAHSDQVIPAARRRRRGHTAPHGQFFTLTEVARFLWHVVEMLAPASQRRVIDLAAGDGILLDEGCRGGFTTRLDVLGLELDAHVLHARSAEGARVEAGDGLLDAGQRLSDWRADVAVGNPPFGRSRDLLTDGQRRRLLAEPAAPHQIWGSRAVGQDGRFTDPAGNCRVEELFLERALRLVRSGGLVAYILSDGVLSNRREQVARDWVGGQAQLLAAIALPASAFRRAGLNALAHLIVLRRVPEIDMIPQPPALMMERRHAGRGKLPQVLEAMRQDLVRLHQGQDVTGAAVVSGRDLGGCRWDPGFWVGKQTLARVRRDLDDAPELGDFIELLTYGPIVTGGQPVPVVDGIASIRQGDFAETGLHASRSLRVLPDSAHDPRRSRVRAGDVLLPRSGGGALGRNRVAVYEEDEPANIGCFVDLIRLRPGLNP
ncbi:MAG: N-6 DNA methylase, partial [Candidatus Latescibacteria bacterium]|nr:N-6 DNA methylase [Candidatus Latescibacterota bacterium]